MAALEHKEIRLPVVSLSHDEGDPRWHAAGGQRSTPVHGEDGSILHHRWNGLHPGHYAQYWELCVAGPWEEAVRAYEASPDDAYWAWTYVDAHPVFWHFEAPRRDGLPLNHVSSLVHAGALTRGWPEVTPHRVCPETGRHEDDDSLNTRTQWWFELGPVSMLPDEKNGGNVHWHDCELDGGAWTYEEAIVKLARAIHDAYGNDRAIADKP